MLTERKRLQRYSLVLLSVCPIIFVVIGSRRLARHLPCALALTDRRRRQSSQSVDTTAGLRVDATGSFVDATDFSVDATARSNRSMASMTSRFRGIARRIRSISNTASVLVLGAILNHPDLQWLYPQAVQILEDFLP